jgi:hypothetical protein
VVDAVLGIPGVSRSTFRDVEWDAITAQGDSLIEVPGDASTITMSWHLRGSDDEVLSYEFSLNEDRRLASAKTEIDANSLDDALVTAQDALESNLSVMSFRHDVPAEVVAWRVTEKRTGAFLWAMKYLGEARPIDLTLTMISSPELRELLSTWREAMNATSPMGQALGFYKIIERVHKYRLDRERRTRNTESHYIPPREAISSTIGGLIPEYGVTSDAFEPFLGKKFTSIWERDLRDRIRNAVAHLREDAPSLTADRAADVETCREAIPVLHYIARTMLQGELVDQEKWPNPNAEQL